MPALAGRGNRQERLEPRLATKPDTLERPKRMIDSWLQVRVWLACVIAVQVICEAADGNGAENGFGVSCLGGGFGDFDFVGLGISPSHNRHVKKPTTRGSESRISSHTGLPSAPSTRGVACMLTVTARARKRTRGKYYAEAERCGDAAELHCSIRHCHICIPTAHQTLAQPW